MSSYKVLVLAAVVAMVSAHYPPVEHYHHAAHPYKFRYDIRDKTGTQYRQEYGDGHNRVKGSYGFTDAHGIRRHVNYVADHGGFRAQIRTNEPGTANQNPASVFVIANPPLNHGLHYGSVPEVYPVNVVGCGPHGCEYRGAVNDGYVFGVKKGKGYARYGLR